MLFKSVLAAAACIGFVAAEPGCNNCTNESPDPYVGVPAPWDLKGDIYTFFLLPGLGIPLDNQLPKKAFPPLERQFPSAVEGDYKGTLGMVQIVRYTESPVGPYDEMFIVPGYFEYDRDGKKKRGVRVSRIYVSQKYPVWTSRITWNQPKHLARFEWQDRSDGSTSVKIYPFDTRGEGLSEDEPSDKPWFQATYSPLLPENLLNETLPLLGSKGLLGGLLGNTLSNLNLNPQIPFTTDLFKLLGINATLIQPPVPAGKDKFGALVPSTPEGAWKAIDPLQESSQTTVGSINLNQRGGDGEEEGVNAVGDEYYDNFWPGLPVVNVALKLKDAKIVFGAPEVWQG
ncbi:hypothetical protein CKM354_000163300 [Cercospora kikuchii]|uniref:Uncharacterized protein n=1 Tax=Cercospora kikuchii TaxID=84275 RepID=A0A9P3CD44_9PEZI|nr:uncharacterized protein CKM354_000163300 [Cercospora kikuchii]GIZ38210.1 hypothetical protein CKM354_000163300 [Cercospora kikuchii]